MRGSYVEVVASNAEPLQQFASVLRRKHGGTDKTESYNADLLRTLIDNRYISKSSIVWQDGVILKIHGLTVDADGKILYNKTKQYPERQRHYVQDASPIDLEVLTHAVIKAKQMAI